MKLRSKIMISSILFSLLLFLRSCITYENPTLKVPKIVVKTPKVIERPGDKHEAPKKTIYVPPEGSIEIKPKDPTKTIDDVIEVKVKWFGKTFHPGARIGLLPISPGIDAKVYFIGRLGVELGVGTMVVRNFDNSLFFDGISPTVGISYRLDKIKWLQNSETVIVYQPLLRVPTSLGLRWNF